MGLIMPKARRMRQFSLSQQRLLDQLSSPEDGQENSEAPREPGPARQAQLVRAEQNLPRFHREAEVEDIDSAFAEWQASCAQFLTDDLTGILEEVADEGEAALAAGQPFHLTSQFCFRLMQWGDQELTLIEQDEEEPSPTDPWPARVAAIYTTAERHLASLLHHLDAVEAESREMPDAEDAIHDMVGDD